MEAGPARDPAAVKHAPHPGPAGFLTTGNTGVGQNILPGFVPSAGRRMSAGTALFVFCESFASGAGLVSP
jgi:hypothetical protein